MNRIIQATIIGGVLYLVYLAVSNSDENSDSEEKKEKLLQTQEEIRELRRKLKKATKIKRSLLPESGPADPDSED